MSLTHSAGTKALTQVEDSDYTLSMSTQTPDWLAQED